MDFSMVFILLAFLAAGILLAAAFLQLNQFEKRVDAFCSLLLKRYKLPIPRNDEESP